MTATDDLGADLGADLSWLDTLPGGAGGHDLLDHDAPLGSPLESPLASSNRAERRAAGERGPRHHRGKAVAGGLLALLIAGLAVAPWLTGPVALAAAAGAGAVGTTAGGVAVARAVRRRRAGSPKAASRALRKAARQAGRQAGRAAKKAAGGALGGGRSGARPAGRSGRSGGGRRGGLPKLGGLPASSRSRRLGGKLLGKGRPSSTGRKGAGIGSVASRLGKGAPKAQAGRRRTSALGGRPGSRNGRGNGLLGRLGLGGRGRHAAPRRGTGAAGRGRTPSRTGIGRRGPLGLLGRGRSRTPDLTTRRGRRSALRNARWKQRQADSVRRWKARRQLRGQRRATRIKARTKRRGYAGGYRPRWWRWLAANGWRSAMAAAWAGIFSTLRQMPAWLWAPTKTPPAAPTPPARPAASTTRPARPTATRVRRPARPPRSPVPHPGPAPAVPRPASPHRRSTRMHVACEHAAESFSESVGGYDLPDTKAVPDVDDFLGSFGDMFRSMGESLTQLADKFASDTPVDQAVAEYIREVGAGLTNMGEGGDEVHQTWREANAADLERHENPRPAEEAFNV